MTKTTIPPLHRLAEKTEAEYFRRFVTGAPPSVVDELGIDSRQIGDGVAIAMREDPSAYWSKAFGFETMISETTIQDAVDFFTAAGVESGVIAVAPTALPPDWETIAATHSLSCESSSAKLSCNVADFRPAPSKLDVRRLTPDDAEAWALVIREAFGMTGPDLTPLLAEALDDPAVQAFAAWDGAEIAGAGALYVFGKVASVNTGGTRPQYERRGVQNALISARVGAAAALGVETLFAETSSPEELNGPSQSFRNLLRRGFEHQYDRPNWRWQRPNSLARQEVSST